jgi:hypothetical protein
VLDVTLRESVAPLIFQNGQYGAHMQLTASRTT